MKNVLAVDLDGTLLHPESEEIALWSRTRYQYLSRTAANKLAEISRIFPIIIATARHGKDLQNLVEELPEIDFFGFVLENGVVVKNNLNEPFIANNEWGRVRQDLLLKFPRLLPDWVIIQGFENCLGFVPPSSLKHPEIILQQILANFQTQSRVYVDGHKLFVYPTTPSKLSGLSALNCLPLLAMGNDWNDLDMLDASLYPFIPSNAHTKVKALINTNRGYCSPLVSHAATEDLLDRVIFQLNILKRSGNLNSKSYHSCSQET